MKEIKAVFFDIDNTIYTHRIHDVLESTRYVMKRLKEKGYLLGVATSRCRYETNHLPLFLREFALDAAIYDGGALVMAKQTILQKFPFRQEQVTRLIHYCDQRGIAVRYSTFDKDCMSKPCSSSIRDEFFKLYLNMPIVKPYEGEEVFNLLAYPQSDAQREAIMELMQDTFIVTHSANILELTANHVNKSVGIGIVADHWNIDMENIACFGDGANDVEMLQAAGIGVAMGNGNPKAKAAGDYVCAPMEEDGIYRFCEDMGWLR